MAKIQNPKSPVQRQMRRQTEKDDKPCRESITTTMDGESEYETVKKDEACAAPGPKAKAEADAIARDNLQTYGEVWCDKGDNKCASRQCVPTLKDIRNQGYKMESRLKSGGKKDCFVIATISGTVTCSCS